MLSGADPTVRQAIGSSAMNGPDGVVEPWSGSTVNARLLESPKFGRTAVVDGDTAAASMVPAEVAPASLTNHI